MKKTIGVYAVTLSILLQVCSVNLWAAAPGEIYYRGQLTGTDAALTGKINVTFSIWDSQVNGAQYFTEIQTGVIVTNGIFTAVVGSATGGGIPASVVQSGVGRWMDVSVAGEPTFQRMQLVAAPYALAVAAGSVGTNELQDNGVSASKIQNTALSPALNSMGVYPVAGNSPLSGKVGINTTTPSMDLDVAGAIVASPFGSNNGNNISIETNAAWNGWARQFGFYSSDAKNGTQLGAFGALGNVGNNLLYLYIGLDYINTWMTIAPSGNVGIGTGSNGANSRLQVKGGDVAISSIGSGMILTAPNGSCYRVTVSNAGTLNAPAAVTCPK